MKVESPDEDDDGGRLGHGSDHTAGTDHTQEGEEGLLAAGTRAFAWHSRGQVIVCGDTRASRHILKVKNMITIK